MSCTVDGEKYPAVFRALQYMDICNGMVNRLEPISTGYLLPAKWCGQLEEMDRRLTTLTSEELETLVDGEDDEATELAIKHGLDPVVQLFDEYFVDGGDNEYRRLS